MDCPACGSRTFGSFLALTIRSVTGIPLEPAIDVAIGCSDCSHRALVGDSVRLGSLRRLDLLREVLELETGMPVVVVLLPMIRRRVFVSHVDRRLMAARLPRNWSHLGTEVSA